MDFKDLTAYLDSLGERFIPERELMVYRNHEVIYQYKTGFSEINHKIRSEGDKIFLIYSSSKISTCVGALRMVERGLLHLEDKVSQYLPEYGHLTVRENGMERPVRTDLRVQHLFTMCGGFSYNLFAEALKPFKSDEHATTREVVAAIAKEPLLFDPGTHFQYSLCHDVLGGLVEVVSGMTLEDYLKGEIFLPLGMVDTGFHLNEEQKERLAVHYVYASGNLSTKDNLCTEFHLAPRYESGGAGIYTTTADYAKLADAIACGGTAYNGYQVLKQETVSMYSRNWLDGVQLADFQEQSGHLGNGYGLGVMVLLDRRPRNYQCAEGIFGWGGAAGTKVVMDTKNKLSFYYSQEVQGGPECVYEEHPHNVITNMLYQILDLK